MSDVTAIEQGEITAQMRSLFQMLPKELACEGVADVKRYFRYNQSAEDALVQLRKKHYADAFASDGRRVYYVGVNYNPAADVRTIDDVKCERIDAKRCRSRSASKNRL